MPETTTKHPVIHFEVMGKNTAKLRTFYGELFGWSIATPQSGDPTEYGIIDTVPSDSGVISGGIGKAPDGYDGHVTFYVRVDDVEDTLAAVEKNGGTRMMGPDNVPMPNGASITIGLFRDPEGHTIGLVDPGNSM
jgi:uncharacterized protein